MELLLILYVLSGNLLKKLLELQEKLNIMDIVLNITRIIWKVNRLAKAIYADLALKIRYLIKIHEASSRTAGKTPLEVQGVLMRWDLGAKI